MLSEGQTFAHYVIEAPIGEGGMGAVYRAHDKKLRRKVALKVIHPDLAVPDAAARLVREARAAAALAHPNTIAIYDLGEIDGTVFLVMELISGAPLRAYVGDDSVPIAQKLRWLVDMARGLGAAHKAGLVHRDVKPTNVMVSDEGVVKVLDFGLAKPVEAASFHSDVGIVVGTPRYMAPELFTGARADARSDQYAFGVTAYELLSGVHPGGAGAMAPVPIALDSLVPEVGPVAARIVARTLSRNASERYPSMNEVATELEEHVFSTRVSPTRDTSPSTRREGPRAPAALALALAPTELPASVTPSASGELSASAPSGAPGASRKSALAQVGATREARGIGLVTTAGIIAVVAAAAVFVGVRFLGLGDAETTSADAEAPLAAASATLSTSDVPDAEAEGGDASAVDELDAGSLDASDDADASDADADADASDADASEPHHFSTEDFTDPWAKPAPAR